MSIDHARIVHDVLNTPEAKKVQKKPKVQKYIISCNNPEFGIEKFWPMISNKPLKTLLTDYSYSVELLPEEHKMLKPIFESIEHKIRRQLNDNQSTLETHFRYNSMYLGSSPTTQSDEDVIKGKLGSQSYKYQMRENYRRGLKMEPKQLVDEIINYIEPFVSWSRTKLEIFVSMLYHELAVFARKWHMGSHTVSSLSYGKSDIDFSLNYSAYDVDRGLKQIKDKKFHASQTYQKLHEKVLKDTNFDKKFSCPQFDEWYALGYSEEDEQLKSELEERTFRDYQGQSFYGFAEQPFLFLNFQSMNDQYDSPFDCICQSIKMQIMGYIAIHNTEKFCEYMDTVIERLRNGEQLTSEQVLEYFD